MRRECRQKGALREPDELHSACGATACIHHETVCSVVDPTFIRGDIDGRVSLCASSPWTFTQWLERPRSAPGQVPVQTRVQMCRLAHVDELAVVLLGNDALRRGGLLRGRLLALLRLSFPLQPQLEGRCLRTVATTLS